MRLLLASAYEPYNEMHGQGVIIKNTLAEILAGSPGAEAQIGLSVFRDGVRSGVGSERLMIQADHVQHAPALSKASMMRSLLGLPLTRIEERYLRKVADIAKQYDAMLWFGSPYDPVTHRIARAIKCPVLYHVTDSISLHEQRRNGRGAAIRRLIATEVERRLLRHGAFAAAIYVGAADIEKARTLFQSTDQGTKLVHLPNGVDIHRFYPRPRSPARQKTILFAGSMCYAPNIDAARRLVHEILPIVRCSPCVRIVGHSPTKEIFELADGACAGGVVITGRVEDISAEYANADLLVAPIELGAGMQNKVLEALASGTPVVTSPLVAGGMGVQLPGMFVCRTSTEYAAKIDQLLSADEFRHECGALGRAHMVAEFSWAKRTRQLWELLNASVKTKTD